MPPLPLLLPLPSPPLAAGITGPAGKSQSSTSSSWPPPPSASFLPADRVAARGCDGAAAAAADADAPANAAASADGTARLLPFSLSLRGADFFVFWIPPPPCVVGSARFCRKEAALTRSLTRLLYGTCVTVGGRPFRELKSRSRHLFLRK